jgi:steroid delta-isomerase-like uncharacterized protein
MKTMLRTGAIALSILLLAACGKQPAPEAAAPQPYIAVLPKPAAPVDPALGEPRARRMLNDWLSAWNAHDTSQAAALLADDVEYFDAGFAGIQHGREAAIDKGMSAFLRGVPDLRIELRGEPIVSKDAVAWEWTFSGTNSGTWGGIPATNQHIQLKGFSLMRLRNGHIVQLSSYYDTGTLNRQLGL